MAKYISSFLRWLGLLVASSCAACATLQNSDIGDAETPQDRSALAFHGNFCGAGHPSIPSAVRELSRLSITDARSMWVDLLAKMPAHDDLDELCKRHDVCYAAGIVDKRKCDLELIGAIQKFRGSSGGPPSWEAYCKRVKLTIYMAIWGKPAGDANAGLVFDVLYLPMRAAVGTFSAPALALAELNYQVVHKPPSHEMRSIRCTGAI